MEFIKGPTHDDLFFNIGWEMDISLNFPKENKSILNHYLSAPVSKSKLNTTNVNGETSVRDIHGPFFFIPSADDYNCIAVTEFVSIVEEAIEKLAEPDDTEEIFVERKQFKQAIIEFVLNTEALTTSDIYFLKWSYRYDTERQFDDLFRYDYYLEFIFLNQALNKIYKAVLGAD